MSQQGLEQRPVDGTGRRVAVVAARFHGPIVGRLVEGAVEELRSAGVAEADIRIEWVPGAWELPLAADWLARSKRYHALVALGAVIRGETAHFEYVARECSRGCAAVALASGYPVGFGVLTCDDVEQAWARAGGAAGNKGAEAARAALEMASLRARVEPAAH